MKIHKNDIPLVDHIKPLQNSIHVCHICLKSCKSSAGLKSHSRSHEPELILSGCLDCNFAGEDDNRMLIRCSHHHPHHHHPHPHHHHHHLSLSIYIYIQVSKIGDRSRGPSKGSLFISYYTRCWGRRYPFPWIAPLYP